MTDLSTTRRGILGAIAGVPLAATFAAIPVPALAGTGEWDRNLADFRAARKRLEASIDAEDKALSRYYAARKALPQKPNGVEIRRGDTVQSAYARDKALHDLAVAADKECQRQCGVPQAEAANSDACEADDDALWKVFRTPAPDMAALLVKFDLVEVDCVDALGLAIADLRRLAGKAVLHG